MKFLIHACPQRMWYVEGYLVPSLLAQGADPESVEIWNDAKGLGNLRSCMASFAARTGDGGTWHIQDDVLLCRDFVKRCRELDEGVVYGFCSPHFRDEPDLSSASGSRTLWPGSAPSGFPPTRPRIRSSGTLSASACSTTSFSACSWTAGTRRPR